MPESLRVLHHNIGHGEQVVICELAIHILTRKSCQAQQYIRGHAVACGGRIVHDFFRAADQILVVDARIEKAVILVIGKQLDGFIH